MGTIQELTGTIGGLVESAADQLSLGDPRAGGDGPPLGCWVEPHCFTVRPITATVCSSNLCFETGKEGLCLQNTLGMLGVPLQMGLVIITEAGTLGGMERRWGWLY